MKTGVRITVRHPLYKRPRKFVLLSPPYPTIGEGVTLPDGKTWMCVALETTNYLTLMSNGEADEYAKALAAVQSPTPPQSSRPGAQGATEGLTLSNAEQAGREAYEEATKEGKRARLSGLERRRHEQDVHPKPTANDLLVCDWRYPEQHGGQRFRG